MRLKTGYKLFFIFIFHRTIIRIKSNFLWHLIIKQFLVFFLFWYLTGISIWYFTRLFLQTLACGFHLFRIRSHNGLEFKCISCLSLFKKHTEECGTCNETLLILARIFFYLELSLKKRSKVRKIQTKSLRCGGKRHVWLRHPHVSQIQQLKLRFTQLKDAVPPHCTSLLLLRPHSAAFSPVCQIYFSLFVLTMSPPCTQKNCSLSYKRFYVLTFIHLFYICFLGAILLENTL